MEEMELNRARRILIVTERYYPEQFLVNEIVSRWVERGFEVTVLTQCPSYPRARLYKGYPNKLVSVKNEGGARVVRIKTVLGYKRSVLQKILNYMNFMILSSLVGVILGFRADAIFVYQTGPLTQALSAALLNRLFSKRTAIWSQDIWPDVVFAFGFSEKGLFGAALKAFVKYIYGSFEEVIVSSPGFSKSIIYPKYRVPRITYIPQWVPEALGTPGEYAIRSFEEGTINYIFAGNIGVMQNLGPVVSAFKIAAGRDDRIRFHVFGDGSARRGLEQSLDPGDASKIIFHGQVGMKEMGKYLSAAQILVISLSDDKVISMTIPAKFQAYLAAKKPILAVCGGQVGMLVSSEGLGASIQSENPGRIADVISGMAALSDIEMETIRKKAAQLLESDFSKEKNINRITELVLGSVC